MPALLNRLNLRHTSWLLAAILVIPSLRQFLRFLPRWIYILPATVLVLFGVWSLARNRGFQVGGLARMQCLLIASLFAWLALSAFWTISLSQYVNDLVLIIAQLSLVFICLTVLDRERIEQFFTILCVCAALVGSVAVVDYILLGSLRAAETVLREIYLTIANLVGAGATVAALRFLVADRNRLKWGILAIVLLIELSLSIARGALVFALLSISAGGLLVMTLSLYRDRTFHGLVSNLVRFSAMCLLIVGTIVMGMQLEWTRLRFYRLFSGSGFTFGERGDIWRQAVDGIMQAPVFGYGLGANGIVAMDFDGHHPHNFLLQVWIDGGLPALALMLILLPLPFLAALRGAWRNRLAETGFLIPAAGAYLFEILEHSKTGNFYTARAFFLFSMLVVALAHEIDRRRSSRSPNPGPTGGHE